jgi:hypothetical protein
LRQADSYEEEASRLLEASGHIVRGRGPRSETPDCYTEEQLSRHRRREFSNNEDRITLLTAAKIEMDAMIEFELQDLFKLGRLNDVEQSIFFRSVIEGYSSEQIAEDDGLGITAGFIDSILGTCQTKILFGMFICPFWGWWEVYWKEVHRYDCKKSQSSTDG